VFDSGALSEDALRRSGMLAQQRATLKAQLGATVAPGLP
jgi:hypothetical protein